MNRNTRIALVVIGLAIIAAAALLISSGGDGTKATVEQGATQSTPAQTPATGSTGATGGGKSGGGPTQGTGGATPGTGTGNGTGGARPDNGTGGAKVTTQQGPLLVAGRVAKISVKQGDTVYVRALSKKDDELHIHGYDYKVELPAGKVVAYKFKADIDGVFVMEFENEGLQVAELKVNP